jgi:hypothetical protein
MSFINSHCAKFTNKETVDFIKQIKSEVDILMENIDERIIDKIYERSNFKDFRLFEKENYYLHLLYKMICRIVFQTNGQIYGGFVRDNFLHDYMADEFYMNNDDDSWENYNNPKVDIKTCFRTLVPRDIDIMFRSYEEYLIFKEKLESGGFIIRTLNYENKYKTPIRLTTENKQDEKREEIDRIKLVVRNNYKIQEIPSHRLMDVDFAKTDVLIDVSISKTNTVDFDFLCNSLAFDKNGLIVHTYNSSTTEEIPDFSTVNSLFMKKEYELSQIKTIQAQIQKMEAVVYSSRGIIITPDRHRFLKMMIKGWKFKLIFPNIYDEVKEDYLTQISVEDDIHCCIICHEDFKVTFSVPGVHRLMDGMKFNCCSASYHVNCFTELLDKHYENDDVISFKCVQCSQIIKRRFFKNSMKVFMDELKVVL